MAEKINVLFLHSQDAFGADSAIHGHFMRYLDRAKFSVHLACSKGDGTGKPPALVKFEEIPDLRVLPTQFAPGFHNRSFKAHLRQLRSVAAFPLDFAALRRYMARERIHIVHSTDRPRDAAYALALCKATGVKSVVHVHIAWSQRCTTASKLGVWYADGVFSISRFVTETIITTGTPRERVHTIHNSVDASCWDPSTDGAGIRREFGIPAEAPLLAAVARLFGQKGHRELFQALAGVRKRGVDPWLLVVGADAIDVHGSSFTAELKTLAAELGITDRVVFTGPRSDIDRIMAACDVFSLASQEEPFGLVFLEAMAMQKPVVALNDGGTPEVVEHERSGLLSRAGDIDTMAENLVRLLGDAALRSRMGAYGRARVVDYFNVQRMAHDAGNAYEAILNGR